MANIYTTEITSDKITSDNPIHQRLFKAYVIAEKYVSGSLLEVGCGEGRGIDKLLPLVQQFTAIDKIEDVINRLSERYPSATFRRMDIPPFEGLPDNAFDTIISFQVIEHIRDDKRFLQEINRVLKPGGTALITTPNRRLSLSRNPWHIREYLATELHDLAKNIFSSVEVKGITGNDKVMSYHEKNRQSVQRITRWDFLNLQYKLPAALLRIPYEILNRWNRNKLQSGNTGLVTDISHDDYLVTDDAQNALDLLLIAHK